MEHEVFVPVAAERLREVLDDPARVARAVPGLQQDAGADPVAGRLKVRIGGHSITYRGSVRLSGRDDGAYAVEGDATEARGTGSVKLALRLRLRDAEGGTALAFEGTADADGRITQFPAETVAAAAGRLLNRFAENLAAAVEETAPEPEPEPEADQYLAPGEFEPRATDDFETTPDADDSPVPVTETPSTASADVSPSSLDPATEDEDEDENDDDPGSGESPVAEAAHARRTMIGRSAEEVDHAPPRGRYAPVPTPQTVSPPTPLRWAAPAAALALASAVVAVRALRRRR
ncbi:SRPBCC domain-containing protein [Streptomyces bullii]|uniref:SRPBCC domain-containing protein n=1 Tax=Streptomyces bullii TaxID=349910 RepID=A0ABW0UQK4_9ACTN